jgi:dTMP kinase
LRKTLLHRDTPLTPLTEALLFIGGRVQLVEERIRPALARGAIVVCDRFHDSTVAYQGFGGGLDVPWLDRVGRAAIRGVMPSLTLLLDVPTSVGFARLGRARDRMERKTMAFHHRVRAGFRRLAAREPRRFVVLDARQPASIVRDAIAAIVFQRLQLAGAPGPSRRREVTDFSRIGHPAEKNLLSGARRSGSDRQVVNAGTSEG